MAKRYRIELEKLERETLEGIAAKKHVARRKMLHARILLKADEGPGGRGWIDEKICEALDVAVRTMERTRMAFEVDKGVNS